MEMEPDSRIAANPYQAQAQDEYVPAPFFGRQAAFGYLYQKMTDSAHGNAALFLGWQRTGKSALLRHFGDHFDDSFIGVYLPLKRTLLAEESDLFFALMHETAQELILRGYSAERIPERARSNIAGLRAWYENVYLSLIGNLIRAQRRLVFLLDDVDEMIDAVRKRVLPEDTFAHLHQLLRSHPYLGMALTLDASREIELGSLSPLINPLDTYRLSHLSPEACTRLVRDPVVYEVPPESAALIHQVTGGHPQLTQRFGHHLYRRWEEQGRPGEVSPEGVKSLIPTVYAESEGELKRMWEETTANEKPVLMAISSLLYGDPQKPVDGDAIESWLVETDYLLDRTAINAAIRGLEYCEIAHKKDAGLFISVGLMQAWLLENAELGRRRLTPGGGRLPGRVAVRLSWLLIAAALLIVLSVIAALVLVGGDGGGESVLPTVTLAGGG